jgi:hypothetical protein
MELLERGFQPVVLNSDGDLARCVEGQDPEAVPLEGWSKAGRCYTCKSSWYDHVAGVIVPCSKCSRRYHQECIKPRIKNHEVDKWLCSVCSGADKDLCTKCNQPFSEQETLDAASMSNNELVQCNTCSAWWHQACHVPPLYPLPLTFNCHKCPVVARPVRAAQAPPRPARRQQARQPRQPAPQPAPAPEPAKRSRRSTAKYNQSVVGAATQATNDLQIGSVLDIYWEESERSFAGTISAYDGETGEHHIKYHDGTDDWEDLGEMTWVLISAPSFRDVSEVNSTRNQRLAWNGV